MFIYSEIHVWCILLVVSSFIKLLIYLMLTVKHSALMSHSSHDSCQFYLFHNIYLSFKFLVSRTFIMSKCHLDHFLLTESIFVESVQMSSSCDHCICLSLSCMLANSSEKCSKCVHVKKSCSFFSQFFFHAEISHLLHAHEKLKQDQTIVKKEKKHLILHLSELQSKNLHLYHHQ